MSKTIPKISAKVLIQNVPLLIEIKRLFKLSSGLALGSLTILPVPTILFKGFCMLLPTNDVGSFVFCLTLCGDETRTLVFNILFFLRW